MPLASSYKKHIFCLEGDWHTDLRDRSSIKAALNFLNQNFGIKYIYRRCGTRMNMEYYLNIWKQKKYSEYSICYLAFHGEPGKIEAGKEFVSLNELAAMLEGSCRDKIIHFGTCKTLDVKKKEIDKFLDTTGALCVSGFRADVEFLESSLFDLILIDLFQRYLDVSKVKRIIKRDYNAMARRLDFKLFYL